MPNGRVDHDRRRLIQPGLSEHQMSLALGWSHAALCPWVAAWA
jgi:hypothetical protein